MRTKRYLVGAFLILFGSASLAADQKTPLDPPRYFKAKADVTTFATNAFAGGASQEITCQGIESIVVYRYGSGVFGCDAAVYMKVDSGWRLHAYLSMHAKDSITASCTEEGLVLSEHRSGKELLTIPLKETEARNAQPEPSEVSAEAAAP